jgi:hypothetical protein
MRKNSGGVLGELLRRHWSPSRERRRESVCGHTPPQGMKKLQTLLAGERARVDALLAEVQACEAHTLADLDALLAECRARVDALLAECRARGEGLVNP